MRTLLHTLTVWFVFFTWGLSAQTFNYGTGNIATNPAGFNTAGTFTGYTIVGNDLTVTGTINMPAGTYNFANVTINAGATVTVPTGTAVPMIIRCTGAFVNNGDFRANGGNGANGTNSTTAAAAGLGCAGGTNGGVGGAQSGGGTHPTAFQTGGNGTNFGTSSGRGLRMCNPTTTNYPSWGGSGGGGGAYGTAGANGGNATGVGTGCTTGGSGGSVYGSADLLTSAGAPAAFQSLGQTTAGDRWILGGSGGGGGGGTQSILTSARAAGGAGGGGGGAVQITANSITIGSGAWIRARGGNGGNGTVSTGANAGGGGGGGGAGGTINLQYMSTYTNNGTLQVSGGIGGAQGFGSTGSGGAGGNGGSGRTLVEQDVVLCTPPTVSATSFGSSSITTSSATLSWARGNGDQVLVIVREGAAVAGGPVSATSYTANSNFALGEALGGGRVVYIGSGTSVNVTNLPNVNTTYHVAVFEFFTAGGGCYQALASALTGTFTTANGPMTYVSSTNVQQTGGSTLGATNQPILRFEVVGGPGTAPALTVSSITFNTTGTTNVADLTGARIFYTGSSTTFSTATPFGSSISNPSGSHTISGSQTMVPGANYFWLVYDVSIVGTPGNVMDAQITSVNVGTAQTPSETDPPGNRTITSLMSLSCGYTFAHFTPTWLSNVGQPGTTVIASGAAAIDDQRWPGQSFASGFTFEFNGKVYNSFGIHSKGFIWFGSTNPIGVFWTPISASVGYEGAIAPFAFDMQAHSASTTTPQVTVRYTGTAPNRVCIIEWTAMRPYANTGGICVPFGFPDDWNRYDFQLHLYENGGTNANRIEFVYRDMNPFCVSSNGASAQVGLRGPNNSDFLNRQGSGNNAHTASTAGTLNNQVISHGANNFFNGNGGMRFTPTFQIPVVTPSPTASNTCPAATVNLSTTSPVTTRQWYKDNLPIIGATAATYTADASGNHIVVVTQSGCSKLSEVTAVTINPCLISWTGAVNTDWNVAGNWSTGVVPPADANILIPNTASNHPTITGLSVSVGNITVESARTLTISATSALTVSGVLTNNGVINVKSGGALVQTTASTLAGTGNYQIERYIEPGPAGRGRFIGSPINNIAVGAAGLPAGSGPDGGQILPNGCNPAAIAFGSPYGNYLELRENVTPIDNCSQSLWFVKSSGNLVNGRGYSIRMNGNQTYTFNGTVNNGDVTVSGITRQSSTIFNAFLNTNTNRGMHLLCNPYPSPIELTAADRTSQGLNAEVFVYNAHTGTFTSSLGNVTIGVGQAFQVRKTNVGGPIDFTFTNAMRVPTTGVQVFSNPALGEYRTTITVAGNGHSDDAIIYFHPDATEAFDALYDVSKIGGNHTQPAIYTYHAFDQMYMNAQPLLTATRIIPMRFHPGSAGGSFSLSFNELESFPASVMIYLEDLQTGQLVDIRANNVYTFVGAPGDNFDRFRIRFEAPLQILSHKGSCPDAADGVISISNPTPTPFTATLMSGINVVAQSQVGDGQTAVMSHILPGSYNLRLQASGSSYVAEEAVSIDADELLPALFQLAANSFFTTDVIQSSVENPSPLATYTWYLNDMPVGNGTQLSLGITQGGIYTLRLKAARNQCEAWSEKSITVYDAVSTSVSTVSENGLQLYPNPAADYVLLSVTAGMSFDMVRILDMTGRVVLSYNAHELGEASVKVLNLDGLASGLYQVQVLHQQKSVGTAKFSLVK